MKTLEALIFDVDGTLAETERDGHRVAFNQAFQEFGLPWHWPVGLYGQLLRVAGGKERIRHYIHRYQPKFERQDDIDELVVGLHQAKARHFQALVASNVIPLRPGVRRLIEAAQREGVRLAIATTSAKDSVIPLLERLLGPDSPTWFEVIAAGDMVPAKKPAPDIYNLVINAMGLNPATCLVVEDSPQGLEAAIAAGLPTVVTVNDYTRNYALPGARLVISHLGEPSLPFEVLWGEASNAYYFSLDLAQALLPS
ncbi:HAD family hydrolase [Nodosilinea sp. LEGE 06152]|uniref:HAD family hydrolase n=1 Tax=Nodosilinea sp. LEGE 06152 TaxID=2777966 RepID=UPI0018824123|nr:HAD family hydrolase [Nodosilinea sp. LEGE 06152]MBE9159160.1 HAD family hydrolase [Nodosilinea sp. LEGE 06152]